MAELLELHVEHILAKEMDLFGWIMSDAEDKKLLWRSALLMIGGTMTVNMKKMPVSYVMVGK